MATYFFDPVINLCYNIYIGRKRRNKYLIQVKKRNGSFEEFTDDKIFNAVKAALVGLTEEETLQTAKTIAEEVTEQAYDGITTERIQETVNEILIRDGFLKTAQDFLEYKNRVAKFSEVAQKLKDLIKPALGAEYTDNLMVAIILNLKHGKAKGYNIGKLYNKFHAFHKAGMTLQDVFRMLEKAASELTTKEEPHWEFVAGNIFAYRIEIETSTYWQGASYSEKVEHMVENKLYGKYLLEYYTPTELNELYNDIVIHDRDLLLNYPAISMLYQRYLVNTHDGKVIERPQELYFRIALHLMMAEPKNKRRNYIRSLYNALSTLKLTMATPTTTNAGTPFHQLSSCFVDTPEDSLDGIFRAITTFSEVSKMGGAEGIYMGNIRANGSAIRGFDGAAGGIIPWGRILNDTAVAVDQLGCVARNSYVKVLESVKTNNFTHRYLKRAEKYNKDIDEKSIELVTNEAKNHAFKYGTFSKITIENLLSDYVNGASPNSSINKYSLSNDQYKKIIGKFKKIDKPVIDGFVRNKTNPDYAINESGDILNLKSYRFLNSYRINKKGYIEATIGKKKYSLHSLLYEAFIGSRNGFTIDHIDKNKLNNQLSNLQLLSNEENISKGWSTKSEIDKRSEAIKVKAHLSYNKALNGKRRNSIFTEILEIKEKIVPISDVKTGDLIKSLDPNTEKVVYKEVEALHDITVKHKDQIKIKYKNGSYIVTSLWHPTYNKKPNEKKFEFIRADQVEVGDVGLTENLEENKVVEVDFNPQYNEDYKDLTIKDTNCYFVSTDEKFNEMYLIHNTRQGAVALYLDIWHKDVPEFLESRKNNGDDRLKLHDSFPAIGYPDYFWYLAEHNRNAMWHMFDPHEIENVMGFRLQDYYGEEWEVRYKQCVAEPKLSRRSIVMKDMIKLIIVSLVETGLPFTFNRDNANKNNPNADKGMIYSSNLCVTGDSMLLTEEGYQSFEELYKTQADITAYVDTRARDLDKTKVGLSKEKSSRVFLTKYDAEVWQLETEDGFELKATPYHKFYVERNGRIEKLELKDLVVGDTLLTASGMVDSNLSSDIIAQLQLLWRNFGVVHKENGKTVLDFQIESFENKHIFLADFNLLDIKASMIEVNGIEYIRVADEYSKFMAMTLGILTPELTSVILEEKDINSPTPEFTTKVSAITVLEEGEDVYDVTVENGHSIIINGIATGNCTEIFMNQSSSKREYKKLEGTDTMVEEVQLGDYPVCNLASLVLGNINLESETELEEIITIAIRALDNVITFNLYPNPLAENTNNKYRAIGLGTSGYHHMLVKRGIKFSSEEHLELVDKLYEDIFYYALKASNGLAKEKGKCPAFSGSLWETGEYLASRNYTNPRWETLQEKITKTGLRNNYLIATAPTGSTSIISNTTAGIDPLYSRYFLEEKKSNILPRVAPDLDSNTFWLYETAHEVDPMWVVRAAGIRQRHIDQGQSVNMYITPTMKMSEILNILIQANKVGMKRIYYFRGQSLEVEECESCAS